MMNDLRRPAYHVAMRAAIVSIGDELALGQNLDTNSQWLAAQLAGRSILTVEHRTLSDDRDAIAQAIRTLAAGHELVLITGGLGPTADDLTREALGDVLTPGQLLAVDEDAADHLKSLFERRGRTMPEMNAKQATRPASMRMMPNPNGTAPGLAGEFGACRIFSMPGPPREMQPMFLKHILPSLEDASGDHVILTAMVQEFGMGESVAAEKLGALMDRDRNPLVGTTASDSIVAARVRSTGVKATAKQEMRNTIGQIEQAWHPYCFGREGVSLVDSVATLLLTSRNTLATAESCTGGLLGKLIVDRAGSSAFYLGGWVTYSNQLKEACLDIPPVIIKEHGAVSAVVAGRMAEAALAKSGAELALSITGIAGPDGGSEEKPVGTVFIALAQRSRAGSAPTLIRRFEFTGDRAMIRDRAAKSALQMLRFRLMEVADTQPLLWELPIAKPTDQLMNAKRSSTCIRR
jgi:nicotinamide-nucleotide amidase